VAENALVAEQRAETGKGWARKLRASGRIPGVVYGRGTETRAITVEPAALERLLRSSGLGANTLIDLQVGGSSETVLLKQLQREPVRGAYLHADFYRVDLTQKVSVSVPVHLVGAAVGVELGGILDHPLREVEIECLPNAIPEFLEGDVAALEIGQSLHVRDLPLPEGVEIRTDADLAIASVSAPAAEEEVAPVEGEEVVEGEGEAAPAEGEGAAGPSESSES
jgi:large subunit ribosomal protein L25